MKVMVPGRSVESFTTRDVIENLPTETLFPVLDLGRYFMKLLFARQGYFEVMEMRPTRE